MLLAVVLGACAGDAPDELSDVKCTKALYDSCNTEHDCDTQNCFPFPAEQVQICTQGCDESTPCPALEGEPVACESGVCKPARLFPCDPT